VHVMLLSVAMAVLTVVVWKRSSRDDYKTHSLFLFLGVSMVPVVLECMLLRVGPSQRPGSFLDNEEQRNFIGHTSFLGFGELPSSHRILDASENGLVHRRLDEPNVLGFALGRDRQPKAELSFQLRASLESTVVTILQLLVIATKQHPKPFVSQGLLIQGTVRGKIGPSTCTPCGGRMDLPTFVPHGRTIR